MEIFLISRQVQQRNPESTTRKKHLTLNIGSKEKILYRQKEIVERIKRQLKRKKKTPFLCPEQRKKNNQFLLLRLNLFKKPHCPMKTEYSYISDRRQLLLCQRHV
jgi:hypothetical protein